MFFVLQNLEICTGTNAFVPVEGIRWRTGANNVGHYNRPPPSQFETAFCKTCRVCAANIYIRRKSVKTLLSSALDWLNIQPTLVCSEDPPEGFSNLGVQSRHLVDRI